MRPPPEHTTAASIVGVRLSARRTFKTRNQPLGLTLAATPNPVPVGKPTVLSGVLSGTGNAGRQVVLQATPFPYTQGFANVPTRRSSAQPARSRFRCYLWHRTRSTAS